jgi:stage III sporulation protein SpoIIIAA
MNYNERRITDDIEELKRVLPTYIIQALEEVGNTHNLLEVVLDLGRVPSARFVDGEVMLTNSEVTRADIDTVVHRIGDFDADNRAGLERTLHRISGIRNRKDDVVGLTCRVGRAVYGTIDIIEELIKSGQNLLMLGPPGVGKTTMLREAARVLAEEKRVIIVDTSNEIGGDGDVPHPAVGRARRMQVSHPERQHEVMIEAVENHNPEVIVIDEIGRELEAMAARTIAERGVQLIGTAHGNTLENLMLNPTLSDLVGGIESVTLSDEEARRRGTQKTVLERRSPPTFDILVELQTRDRIAMHEDVAAAVDGILRAKPLPIEVRYRDETGKIHKEMQQVEIESSRISGRDDANGGVRMIRGNKKGSTTSQSNGATQHAPELPSGLQKMTVYAYGVARNRLHQAAKRLNVPMEVVDDFGQADAVVTLKNYYRRRPKVITDAERRGMPIYVLRANTVSQMENFLTDVYRLEERNNSESPFEEAVLEAEQAVMRIRSGEEVVILAPQSSPIRRQQHDVAREHEVFSKSHGKEPHRHVRFYSEDQE